MSLVSDRRIDPAKALRAMGIDVWTLRHSAAEAATEPGEPPAAAPPAKPVQTQVPVQTPAQPPVQTPAQPPVQAEDRPASVTPVKRRAAKRQTAERAGRPHISVWHTGQWLVLCDRAAAGTADKLIQGLLTSLRQPAEQQQSRPPLQLNLQSATAAEQVEEVGQWLSGLLSNITVAHILLLGNPLHGGDQTLSALESALAGLTDAPDVLVTADIPDLLSNAGKRMEMWQDLQGMMPD